MTKNSKNRANIDPLNVGGHLYAGFYRIQHADANAGFCALMTYALNGVRRALDRNLIPVVDYSNHDLNHYFYDPEIGENIWEYYFEPVMSVSPQILTEFINDGSVSEQRVFVDPGGRVLRWNTADPHRIATFWADKSPEDPESWMCEKRQLGRDFVRRYIKVKGHILATVESFKKKNFKDYNICGVHIRGTDFAYAEPTPLEKYFDEIHRLDKQSPPQIDKIFLATDQSQFVTAFKQEFGEDRVITYSAIRSDNDLPAFLNTMHSSYQKGEDVLIDVLLLSSANYLIKGAAAVGEYAMWFNSQLECTDFALSSRYDFTSSGSAYLKLNIGNVSSAKWRGQLAICKTKLITQRIYRPLLDAGMWVGKRILPKVIRDILWKRLFKHIY